MPLRRVADGVRVSVRLNPRAGAERIDGIRRLADGSNVLAACVAAPPADGQANEALLWLLARHWGLPRRDLAIAAGHKSRNKAVHVSGDPDATMARLAAALALLPQP
jgi:hypothetical protein